MLQRLKIITSPLLKTEKLPLAAFFSVLFLVNWHLYFWNIGHFFQGDTIFLLHNRASSVSELFWREFTVLNPSGWYRPLANEILESLLYPILGLNPAGYRIPVYALFMAINVAVYILAFTITRRRVAAAVATFYFSIHTTNAYTTYDIGFMPELLYAFFYIVSVLAYLRYLERGSKAALRISLACFAASLLSKEAAVTLPAVLIAFHILIGFKNGESVSWSERILGPIRATLGHSIVLVAYLFLVIGYLHVQSVSIESLLNPPAELESASYGFVINRAVFKNADYAMSWAFNIPRGSNGFLDPKGSEVAFLKVFRVLVLTILVFLLFGRERWILLAGTAWFFLTILPALPLVNHFVRYYLFLPVVGFSMLIGLAFTWMYDRLKGVPFLAPVLVAGALAGVLYVCSVSIHADIRNDRLLGGSADLALTSLNDLKRLYPALPPNAMIHINDDAEPLWWDHNHGNLIKMAYDREDVRVLYSSLGQQIPPDMPVNDLILLQFENRRLIDYTAEFRGSPRGFISYRESEGHILRLSKSEVSDGDAFAIGIDGFQNVSVNLTYTLNDGPVEIFTAQLDSAGQASFEVSPITRKGVYRFLGFNIAGNPDWFRSEGTIIAR